MHLSYHMHYIQGTGYMTSQVNAAVGKSSIWCEAGLNVIICLWQVHTVFYHQKRFSCLAYFNLWTSVILERGELFAQQGVHTRPPFHRPVRHLL